MHDPNHAVFVVDDDVRVRTALEDLLSSCGMNVTAFDSAAAFLSAERPAVPSCLVLDVDLPDVNGLELQRRLAAERHPPIVFITGYGDITSSVEAMKGGAVDFLPKPFEAGALLKSIRSALALDRQRRAAEQELDALRTRYAKLTPREREVLPLVVRGMLNKQAAAHLGISLVTLQIHRGNIMRKMAAKTLSDLVRMSIKLAVPSADSSAVRTLDAAPVGPHRHDQDARDERIG
jgi:FixJ family two-component response regulator